MRTSHGVRATIVASIAVLGLLAAACGSDDEADAPNDASDGSDTTGSETTQVESVGSLTVALPTVSADSLNYVAQAEGMFEEHGVEVELVLTNPANLASFVASGEADLGVLGIGGPLATSMSGRQTSIVFPLTGGGQGGAVFGSPDVETIEALADIDGCKIGTLTVGTSANGYAEHYNQGLELGCEIVPFQDPASQVGALSAGRINAIVGAYANYSSSLEAGQSTLLVDTRDPAQAEQYLGDFYPEVALYGVAESLEEKRDVVIAYIRSLLDAQAFIEANDAADVAESIKTLPQVEDRTVDLVEQDVNTLAAYRFRGTDEGNITAAQWDIALDQVVLWGIPDFDPDAPVVSYEEAVDMSYYEEAAN